MHATKHAANSAEKFGGVPQDYLAIHLFLDSSKAQINDARHRALTHTSWFIREVLPRVFGDTITNSSKKLVSVTEIGEQHVLEDFGMLFVPTPQDFLGEMELVAWMDNARNGATPPSRKKVREKKARVKPSVPKATRKPPGFGFGRRPCGNAGQGILD